MAFLSNSIRSLITEKKFRTAILVYARDRLLNAIPSILKACGSLFMHDFGKSLHCEIIKVGLECDVMVATSLLDMYGKCRDGISSRKVFDQMPERNAITWNAMIGGYMRNGDMGSASILFEEMVEKTSTTWNVMIGGYARNGDMEMARQVFESVPECLKNVVTWTVMVDGYVGTGDMEAAKDMFDAMTERNFYVWSVMISGYFKKGDVVKAREVFDSMSFRNLVNWNSLISGYAQNGLCEEALEAFTRMQEEGFEPDEVTFASALSACAQSGRLDVGKELHEMILENEIELNQFVLNGLVDMYAKCGDLSNARLTFEGISVKNCATWNTLISGFCTHGQCREAIELFGRMVKSGVKPDGVTFLCVLSACAHGGLVEEGLEAFHNMKLYGLTANIKHYGCLVDMLGRVGKLQEALDLVAEMPMDPNDTVLGALLGACKVHGDTVVIKSVLELVDTVRSHGDDAHYVLLSNIYAASERWEMAEGMRVALSDSGSEKTPGCSALVL